MTQEVSQGESGKEIVDMWLKWALIATVVATVAIVGTFLYVRKLKREIKRGYSAVEEPSRSR